MGGEMLTTVGYSGMYNISADAGNFSTVGSPVPDPSLFLLILKKTYLITLPVICTTGVLGNVLAFFVFASKPLRRTSCSWYLAARSVSDGGFLLANFLTWTSDATKLHFFHTNGICQVIIFMTFVFAFLSVWLTVVVTVENYIRICRPFSVQRFCNVPIARKVILALLIIGLVMYNYPMWTSTIFPNSENNVTVYYCLDRKQYEVLVKWLSFWDMLITLIVPSLIIIILMVAITFSLIKSLKRQSRLQAGSSRPRNNAPTENSSRASRSNSSPQAKVTRMLFAVSFFFILLNGPSHVIRMNMVIDQVLGSTRGKPSAREQAQVIFQLVYYSSFAVNLIIYLTCGDNFRKQFKETYFGCCTRHRSPRTCSEMTAMSIVKTEELEQRHEDQAALIDNGNAQNFSNNANKT